MSSQMGTPTRMPLDGHRTRGGTAREQALFVEHAVIRQVGLEAKRGDAALDRAARRHCRACRPRPRACRSAPPGRRPRSRAPVPRPPRGRPPGTRASAPGLPADSRQMNNSGSTTRSAPSALRLVARGARLGGVAGDVADRRVQLGQRDRERRVRSWERWCLAQEQTAIACFRSRPCVRRWRTARTRRPSAARRRPPPTPCP